MTDTTSSIRSADLGGATVVRSEERLIAGTVAVPVRRAVVRKRIVTEERTIVVPVSREELYLDYEGVDAGHLVADDGASRDIELVLSEERIDVRTVVVPVERVRVRVVRVTGEQIVAGEVRRERIEIDGEDIGDDRDPVSGRHRDAPTA